MHRCILPTCATLAKHILPQNRSSDRNPLGFSETTSHIIRALLPLVTYEGISIVAFNWKRSSHVLELVFLSHMPCRGSFRFLVLFRFVLFCCSVRVSNELCSFYDPAGRGLRSALGEKNAFLLGKSLWGWRVCVDLFWNLYCYGRTMYEVYKLQEIINEFWDGFAM